MSLLRLIPPLTPIFFIALLKFTVTFFFLSSAQSCMALVSSVLNEVYPWNTLGGGSSTARGSGVAAFFDLNGLLRW